MLLLSASTTILLCSIVSDDNAGLCRCSNKEDNPFHLDDTHHNQRSGEDCRRIRDAAASGRRSRRSDDREGAIPGPVYPWFGKDISRIGGTCPLRTTTLLRRLWREDVVDWERQIPDAARSRSPPRRGRSMVCRPSFGTALSARREIAEQTAHYGDGFFHNNIFWPPHQHKTSD